MRRSNRTDALRVARAVLAADCACSEADLLGDQTIITLAQELPGRRRFPRRERPLNVTTMGNGVIVSCDAGRISWAKANLEHLGRDAMLSTRVIAQMNDYIESDGQLMNGPRLAFLCSDGDLRPAVIPDHVRILLFRDRDVEQLYGNVGFSNALSYGLSASTPDVLAVAAESNGQIVGIAGASADCDVMWQIGIDIVASARGRGIGKALVTQLTREVLNSGRIPYYSTSASNVRSHALAVAVGYWPAWVGLYAKDG